MDKRLDVAFYLGWWLLSTIVVLGGTYLLFDRKPTIFSVTSWLIGSLIGHLIARYRYRR